MRLKTVLAWLDTSQKLILRALRATYRIWEKVPHQMWNLISLFEVCDNVNITFRPFQLLKMFRDIRVIMFMAAIALYMCERIFFQGCGPEKVETPLFWSTFWRWILRPKITFCQRHSHIDCKKVLKMQRKRSESAQSAFWLSKMNSSYPSWPKSILVCIKSTYRCFYRFSGVYRCIFTDLISQWEGRLGRAKTASGRVRPLVRHPTLGVLGECLIVCS